MIHNVTIHSMDYHDIASRKKHFLLLKDTTPSLHYGDVLHLTSHYNSDPLTRWVSYVLDGLGLVDGWCIVEVKRGAGRGTASMIPHGPLTRSAEALLTMSSALAHFVESHGASCVCCHCLALHAGQEATDLFALVALLVEAQAREELLQHRTTTPYRDLLHQCGVVS